MLKAIGLGKSKAPKEEDVRRAREQAQLRAQWRRDVAKLRVVVEKLRDVYAGAKGGFAVGRYEQLKTMIKDAVLSYRNAAQEIKDAKLTGSLRKVDGGGSSAGGSVGGTLERQKKSVGLMARLRQSAQNFATHDDMDDLGDGKSFDDMTAKELEAEAETMRKEVLRLKAEFYAMKDKLEWLAQEYETSKKLQPTQRYAELKRMAKSVIRENYGAKKE